jgi:dienelactone hydrolase
VYGENDARIDTSVPDIAARLKALGKSFTYETYPGTGHGFLKPGREGSDGPQVERAWGTVLKFLKDKLGG